MTTPVKRAGLVGLVGAAAAACLLNLTPAYEGTVTHTYRDLGGVLTYCTGATENAKWGMTYTMQECRDQLDKDLAKHAQGVLACVHVPINDNEEVAYVDFAYNAGVAAFCGSSMARRLNAGDHAGACAALSMWDKVNGKPVAGLTRRRAEERAICEGRIKIARPLP